MWGGVEGNALTQRKNAKTAVGARLGRAFQQVIRSAGRFSFRLPAQCAAVCGGLLTSARRAAAQRRSERASAATKPSAP